MNDIYGAFSEQLQHAQQGHLALLDPDDGLLARWEQLCDEHLQNFASDLDATAVEHWTLERNTWALVQTLYAHRLEDQPAVPSSSKNPYTPPRTVAERFVESSKDLVELSAIREWLNANPSSLNPAEIRRGYLPYTKNKLKHLRRTGAPTPQGLVTQLDPDALLRAQRAGDDDGAHLESDDAAYERALLRSLYEYVRAGETDLAIDMCRQSDQAWRAASLAGGRLFQDPALAPDADAEDDDEFGDSAMDGGEQERRVQGNANRRLWKTMCRKLAANNTLDPYERALYGALSGDVASVLPVCSTWEDVVWAHTNALLEAHVEAGLASSASGRYFERGTVAPLDPKAPLDPEDALLGAAAAGRPVRDELDAVFERLMHSDRTELANAAKNPFHVSQAYLIIGKIGNLLETFVKRIEDTATGTEPELLAHLLRFFAHLILVLRLLDQPLPAFAANHILEAYVHVLEAHDQDENLIAFYASNLEQQSAVESYARFLLTFGPDSDITARHLALRKSREHGLSLPLIARRTVELVLSSSLASLPSTSAAPRAIEAFARVDARQMELIRAIEWLTAEKETYEDAVAEANALARWFLSTDAPHAARELLRRLPADLLSALAAADSGESTAVQLDIREHLDYVALFNCLGMQGRWAEVWARRPSESASKLDLAQYKESVATLVDQFYTSTVDLLSGEWLQLDGLDATVDAGELAHIRRLVVPDLVFRMHRALVDSSSLVPSTLPRALALPALVADERHALYREFVPSPSATGAGALSLGRYLDEVRRAALLSLERGTGVVGVEEGKGK
ncbi:Nucleoporin nup84 [Rhodotorula kratochvilovae]